MDQFLRSVQELRDLCGYKGSLKHFRSSKDLVSCCRKNQVIANITSPSDICVAARDEYFTHLTAMTKKYLFEHKEMKYWETFKSNPENRKIQKILFEFGVRGELFSDKPEAVYDPVTPDSKKVTLEELYEVYQIKFNFDGSFLAFKRQLQKTYGSYAEFCLEKGYDINTTKWESDETALRVAAKLGSPQEVKQKCPSLWKYLEENKLIKVAFKKGAA